MARTLHVLLVTLAISVPLTASEALDPATLTPRVGETIQEFEARRSSVKSPVRSQTVVTVPADRSGHFLLETLLDGQRVRMVVDTGASVVALTYADAERIGAQLSQKDFKIRMSTANGSVSGAPIRIDEIRIENVTVKDVEAVVLPHGKLDVSLLGMSFLKRLSGFEIAQGQLRLRN